MSVRRVQLFTVIAVLIAGLVCEVFAADVLREPEITAKEKRHWAFQPLVHPEPPDVGNADQVSNPIDRFILRRLESRGLGLMGEADRRTLIRRLSFDLTGLPPTVEEIDAFLRDESSNAYQRVVDRLLDSAAYGERWAQHWLDLARFAETDGFEHDKIRPDAWRYRDWVINALNEDLPYDQFVQMQLAGDELFPNRSDAAIATGFLLSGPDMPDINSQEERRNVVLNEITSTVGAALLGLGLECAQCHDHKYDPVSQVEFYRMRAFFENTVHPSRDKPLGHIISEPGASADPARLMIRGDHRRPGPELTPAVLRIGNPLGGDQVDLQIEPRESSTGRRAALAQWLTRPDHPLALRAIANRLWMHHFGTPLVGTPNDLGMQGEKPSHPELLDWLATELPRRGWSLKEMHRLIVSSATYRQAGVGEGAAWELAYREDLANELYSRARQRRLSGETVRDSMLAVSRSLNREAGGAGVRPPLSEEITVTLLKNQWQVSTNTADHHRRSIYLFARRNMRFPMFDVFDRPDANASCARRHESTTAPQALTLLNSDFSLEMARRFAAVTIPENSDEIESGVTRAFEMALSRPPSTSEIESVSRFLREQAEEIDRSGRSAADLALPDPMPTEVDSSFAAAWVDLCRAIFNLNEFLYVD